MVSLTAQCSVDDPIPSRILNLLKAAHATCPLGKSWGDPVGCRGLAGSLGVDKGDHAQVPCGVRDTQVLGQVSKVGPCRPSSCHQGPQLETPSCACVWGYVLTAQIKIAGFSTKAFVSSIGSRNAYDFCHLR